MIRRKKIFMIHFFPLMIVCFLFQSIIAQEKPNIIFIMADDLGYGEVGAYGQAPSTATPSIITLPPTPP